MTPQYVTDEWTENTRNGAWLRSWNERQAQIAASKSASKAPRKEVR